MYTTEKAEKAGATADTPDTMEILNQCPACGCEELTPQFTDNDLATRKIKGVRFDPRWGDSDFALCERCGLLFARQRQTQAYAPDYYRKFAVLENRYYSVYPPPTEYIEPKGRVADQIIATLEEHKLLRPDARVLHVRCDVGSLLVRLRDQHGIKQVYGLDYFEPNVRYASKVNGLNNVDTLTPERLHVPFDQQQFDVIVSNHMVTHAFRPLEMLEDLRALLAPGGTILFYNEQDHLEMFRQMSRVKLSVNNFHKQLLTSASMLNLCKLAGLDCRIIGMRKMAMIALATAAEPVQPQKLTFPADDFRVELSRWVAQHDQEVREKRERAKERRRQLEERRRLKRHQIRVMIKRVPGVTRMLRWWRGEVDEDVEDTQYESDTHD